MTPEAPAQYQVRCRFCGEIKKGAPFVPLVNGQIDERMMKMGQMLFKHMMEKHAQQMGIIVMLAGFEFEDPTVRRTLEPFRVAIRHATIAHYVTDEQLKDRIARLDEDASEDDSRLIFEFARELRDYLTESGTYMPNMEQPVPEAPVSVL